MPNLPKNDGKTPSTNRPDDEVSAGLLPFRRAGVLAALLLVLALLLTAWHLKQRRDHLFPQRPPEDKQARPVDTLPAPEAGSVRIDAIEYPLSVKEGVASIPVTCTIFCEPGSGSRSLIPLVVLLDDQAQELREQSGDTLVELKPGQEQKNYCVHLSLDGISSGSFFLAVIPTDPKTGKKSGKGVYHQPLTVSGEK